MQVERGGGGCGARLGGGSRQGRMEGGGSWKGHDRGANALLNLLPGWWWQRGGEVGSMERGGEGWRGLGKRSCREGAAPPGKRVGCGIVVTALREWKIPRRG